MSYVVLARKWRPQQFEDVLGQEHVTQTLSNAIRADRIAHAFLFSGPRGVGKTSAARILAKALCCINQDGPTPTPCGTCRQCVEITEGGSTDVFEIDAASHTGVDNVREIIDNVRYLPSSARFKIYVIDEVHMLSTGAFNALLKTLEEPPEHVKFILATTDVHKVPVTILSRVQRYDFRRIPLARIGGRLSEILAAESIEHEPSALSLVAREAEGSMRDAQSLIEQVLAFAHGRRLDGPLIREALGVVDGALIDGAFEAILSHEPGPLIDTVFDVHQRGLDLQRFGNALIEHARDLLVARIMKDPSQAIDRPADEIAALQKRAADVAPETLERIFEGLCRVVEDLGRAVHQRYTLEVGLAGLAAKPAKVSLPDVLSQLTRVETILAGGTPPKTQGRREQRPAPRAPRRVEAPQEPKAPPPRPEAKTPTAAAPAPPPQAAPTPAIAATPPADYEAFVQTLRGRRPSLAATLGQVRPLAFGPKGVKLGCETSFDQKKLEDRETRTYVEALLEELFGHRVGLEIQRLSAKKAGSTDQPETPAEKDAARKQAEREEKVRTARERPAVKAVTELGAEIARIRVHDEG